MTVAVLVEGDDAAWEQAIEDATRAGWEVSTSLADGPARGGAALYVMAVRSAEDAAAAALSAIRGHSLLLRGQAERGILDPLCADLRHIGIFAHRCTEDAVMDRTERTLLATLAAGGTLTAAADAAHVSRRTADRRIAALRQRFRVPSVAALIALDQERLGDFPAPMMARITDV